MKKFIAIITVLLLAGLFAAAQNPFIKDQEEVYLKVSTDKVGIGLPPTTAKVTIGSVAGEVPLAIKGYSSPYNPYLALYSSDGIAIWRLFANPNWFSIGASQDSTTALMVGKISRSWVKFNATVSATKVLATTGTITTLGSTTATLATAGVTTLTATTGTITTLGATAATLATASTTTLTTTYFSASDTLGLYLYNAAGTRYRIFVTASGTVSITTAP